MTDSHSADSPARLARRPLAEGLAMAHRADLPELLGDAPGDIAYHPSAGFANIESLLKARAHETPDAEFLSFVDQDSPGDRPYGTVTRRTYAQILSRVEGLLDVLHKLGLRHGQTISTADRYNHEDTVCLLLAAWAAGLRVAPLNVEEDDGRLAFILKNAEARVVFGRAEHWPQMQRIRVEAGNPRLVAMGDVPHETSLAALEQDATPESIGSRNDHATSALLVYTSGTTGQPKGVELAHALLINPGDVCVAHALTSRDVFATAMRLFHVNAIVTSMMAALVANARLVLLRRWDPKNFWRIVADEKVTQTSVVPAMLSDLLRVGGDVPESIRSHFRALICGAGTLRRSLAEQWIDTTKIRITHGWGMSETTCWGCWLPHDLSDGEYRALMLDDEAPSIGMPHGSNRMGIMAADGTMLGPHEKGQIVLAGRNVMVAYFGRDEANRDTFKHGVLETGDEGFWAPDSKGRPMFYITGRLKDVIERGGEKFSPYQMDDDFTAMPEVRAALVFGFAHERLGQEIGVVLELDPGASDAAQSAWLPKVQARAKELGYSWAKAPKEVRLVPSIPKTSTGKETRKMFVSLFDGCGAKHYPKPPEWKV